MEVKYSYEALVITYQTTPYHSPEQCFQNLILNVDVQRTSQGKGGGGEIETPAYGIGNKAAVMSGK